MLKKCIFSFSKHHLIPLLLIAGMSFPIWIFVLQWNHIQLLPFKKLFHILWLTFSQATLSLLGTWIFALPVTLLLIQNAHRKWHSLWEWALLIPLLLPPIVIAGGLMNILEIFHLSSFGSISILLGHAVTYSGAVAITLSRAIVSKCQKLCEWAYVHQVSRWHLLITLFRSSLKKDMQLISLAIFCFCFTSFSIPVLMSHQTYQTIEVAIYEYLKNPHYWPIAFGLLCIEVMFIFLLSFFVFIPSDSLKANQKIPYLGFKKGIWISLIPLCIVVFGMLEGIQHLPTILRFPDIIPSIQSTLFLSFSVSFSVFAFLNLVSFFSSCKYLRKFLIGYSMPSTMFVGFAFLMVFRELIYFSWIAGLTLLFAPVLYRFAGESLIDSLQKQIQVAQTLGAKQWSIWKTIIWPQCANSFCLLASIAGFWASGEFAFTMVTGWSQSNLALIAQQLMSQYRLEQALAVIWLFIAIGSLPFLFLTWLVRIFCPRMHAPPKYT